ncbi:hypothetical protein Q8F55_004101 [Vanrija albida]|uniref:ABC transmembrane type-1 domain-containing protein n=1 Tax=Vanrija albida TaxID=181172 RepID=A0ABR3Q613_9TREE
MVTTAAAHGNPAADGTNTDAPVANTSPPPASPGDKDKASTTTANDANDVEKITLSSARRDEEKAGESESDDEDVHDGAPGGRLRDLGRESEDVSFKREHWWQIWRPRNPPPPPSKSFDDAAEIPLATANLLSALTFHWVSPIMKTGYQRPLQATDLWKMDHSREADYLSDKFLANLERRQKAAAEWNEQLPTAVPKWTTRTKWAWTAATKHHLPPAFAPYGSDKSYAERKATLEAEWRGHSGKKKGSITWALNDTFPNFWWGGVYKLVADEAQLMAPLVVKALINFSKEMYQGNHHQGPKPNVGRGIGMAIGMFCLAILQTLCQHQFFFLSMQTGAMSRAALISAVYKRSLRLSVRARSKIPNGKLMAHLSSDISRIDYCAQWFHAIWTAPIQLIVTLILLIVQIGPSAIVGFALFIILTPLQTYVMGLSLAVRKKSMVFTDGRSKLLQEILSSMQIIKVFTYELPFLKRLSFLRNMEMKYVRKIAYIRAANMSLAFSVPALATVLAFVTYTSTHKNLDPAVIFTSLALFNLLRQPLLFLPRALSTYADAKNAVERLTDVFEAEIMEDKDIVNPDLDVAIRAKGVTFQWASIPETEQIAGGKGGKGGRGGKGKKEKKTKSPFRTPSKTPPKTPSVKDAEPAEAAEPFKIEDLNLEVPRGRLVAIVGPVGSGKSSILQGLLGEMRTLSGTVEFGGRAGYCQQSAWIQNATLRDNILFGQKWDESRYWQCVADASLLSDLEILPDGDLTEIGEKGVNLSGGQKQRVNIARAMYFNSDIVLFDDPLSAVDAHVGKALFHDAILGLRARGKTVVLVTHALHLLPQVDYIYTVTAGRIVEQGTFENLLSSGGAFKRLMDEFGGQQEAKQEEEAAEEEEAIADIPLESPVDEKTTTERVAKLTRKLVGKAAGTGKLEASGLSRGTS